MSISDALNEIRSVPKWYMTSSDRDNLIQVAQRIEDGRAKPETIKKFFSKFGYDVELNMEVTKK